MDIKKYLIAQNVNIYLGDNKNQFARTGEIGFYHLKKAGATGIILGHSEVKDDSDVINKKWISAIKSQMLDNVVLIGEDWEDLEKGWDNSSEEEIRKMKEKIKEKLEIILKDINKEVIEKTVFGYEPSWATRGSGREDVLPPQPNQIENMCSFIKNTIKDKYNTEISVIYGGSSSPERAKEIMPLKNVNGLILGSACKTTDWVRQIGEEIIKSNKKGVLVLNWKAYELEETYEDFIKIINQFDGNKIKVYLAPIATELKEVKELLI